MLPRVSIYKTSNVVKEVDITEFSVYIVKYIVSKLHVSWITRFPELTKLVSSLSIQKVHAKQSNSGMHVGNKTCSIWKAARSEDWEYIFPASHVMFSRVSGGDFWA